MKRILVANQLFTKSCWLYKRTMLSQQVATGSNVDATRRLIKFKNCRILRDHKIIREDLWVRNGKIINPEKIFFDEKRQAHLVNLITHQSSSTSLMTSKIYFFLSQQIDCHNAIISPGFIDLQINGSFVHMFYFLVSLTWNFWFDEYFKEFVDSKAVFLII